MGSTPDQPRRALSMRAYLVLMVMAILLPLMLFAAILFQRYYDSELTRVERDLKDTAHELSLDIDRDLQGQLLTLETLAGSGSLARHDFQRFYERASRIRLSSGVDVLLRDRAGQQILNTRLPWGAPLPRDQAEGDDVVVTTKKPYVSNVIVGTVARRPVYFVTVPVIENGDVAYFLHLSFEPDHLLDIVKDDVSGNQIAGILDRNNVVLVRNEDMENRAGKRAAQSFIDHANGPEGSWLGTNTQGYKIRVGYARSKVSGWLVWVGVPEENIQGALRGTLLTLTGIGVGLIILAVGIAYLLAGRLSGASRTLVAQAGALGRGEPVPAETIPVREFDDVGHELAAAGEHRKDLERRLVEKATQDSERRFQILVQGVTDYSIFMLDPKGNVTNWNSGAMRIKGYSEEEIVGQHFSRFYTDEEREAGVPTRALLTAINEGKYEAEGWRVRKDGTRFWASVVIDRIDDANGNLVGLAKITRDITERRDAQQRLETAREQLYQSQKMDAVGQLTGGVAHDFNNLLTIIIGNLDTAKRTLENWQEGARERLQRTIDNALTGANRAAALTGHLLAFSRRQPLKPTLLDVNKLLRNLSVFLKPSLGEQVQLEVVGAGGVWQVEADAGQLEVAILNLAVNARDAMPNGGKVTIEASNVFLDERYCSENAEVKPGQYVQISVTDSGIGMTGDIVSRVFEPFFTTKQAGHGTGLGLSQVYGFVKQSGGNVKIYSEEALGTTVKIYLPRAYGKKTGEYPVVQQTVTPSAYGKETILVVEDDDDVRSFICETLEDLKYVVLQASDADSALEIIGSGAHISLLLTDVILPGRNGRELADAALARRPELKVLFMTGYSRNAIVHQGRLDEGVQLIQKPLTQSSLASRLRDILDGR